MEIKEIGERDLIAEIWNIIGEKNEDEDVHFFANGNQFILLAMDTINENYHFKRKWDPFKVGKFVVDINLSDIASKNGSGLDFMISISLPSNIQNEYVVRLIEGINEECKRYNLRFSGGDLKESDTISLTGLVIGRVEKGKEFRRNGARPGDNVYITNKIGKNEQAIIRILEGDDNRDDILDITPRINELKTMSKYHITSCIDNSDGIYKSLNLIARLSGVSISISNNVCTLEGDDSNRRLCYDLGGDYELIFTSPDIINEFYLLGKVQSGSGVFDLDGSIVNSMGYNHFKRTY